MKKISVLVAAYNEEENVKPLAEAVINVFETQLPEYDYELVFIDNHSTDGTRAKLRELCAANPKIKAIFNARNFGSARSGFHGLAQTTGDCTIKMASDFQDPPEMIEKFVREWEKGSKIVLGIKTSSNESRIKYFLRGVYYKVIKKISEINHIEQFTGFGLYDKAFIEVIRDLHDPLPYLRGIVAELGFDYSTIPFNQPKRRSGKSKFNWYALFDLAMTGITSYSKLPLRIATLAGGVMSGLSFVVGFFYLISKLIFWDKFSAGMAPVMIGMFFLGAIQLFFLGLLGEYILAINIRVMDRPLVVEEERLNFDQTEDKKTGEDAITAAPAR